MQVYKFGGASVKDAAAILNLCCIVKEYGGVGPLLIVVSAMGKTTNALEEIYDLAYHGQDYSAQLAALETFHYATTQGLLTDAGPYLADDLRNGLLDAFYDLKEHLTAVNTADSYDEQYDQIVSYGELLASEIVAHVLNDTRLTSWVDCRSLIRTNDNWREGYVDWPTTKAAVQTGIQKGFVSGKLIVTQGFVGGTADGRTTTLGREGSDYSAAIFAYCLKAESVTIWKDVPGLLNADPKIFPDTVLYPEISYQETIEMAFYGASVIHPKTLKPLAERGIPLRVRSFLDPAAPGTLIHDCQHAPLVPAFIRKAGQCLISFESKDFAFISEENLEVIFGALAQARLKINLMQNSAISFSVCVDYVEMRVQRLLELLQGQFRVQYNAALTLFTIKHYDEGSIARLTAGHELLLEQRTRSTFQFLVRE
ncbi:aspartate kinase [Hymenobacter sp. UV11]|nr:aspartate kinase [Hymenobacter sp. UV11]